MSGEKKETKIEQFRREHRERQHRAFTEVGGCCVRLAVTFTNMDAVDAFDRAIERLEEMEEDYSWLDLDEVLTDLREAKRGLSNQ